MKGDRETRRNDEAEIISHRVNASLNIWMG
jgi:hypothetical protein